MRRFLSFSVAILVALALYPSGVQTASAVDQPEGRLVSDDPAGFTPHALDGQVYSVAQEGATMVVGGTFTTARNNNDPTVLTRNRLMAFNATNGAISTAFNPSSNGTINAVLPAGDGTVWVGGSFTTLAGKSVKNLARLRISDGSLVTTFNGGSPTGVVKDLALVRGKLWVGGAFTHIHGRPQAALATLNPTTGAFDSFFSGTIAGVHRAGSFMTVLKMDANPQGERMAVVGNFDTLNGVKNHQLLLLDTSGTTAQPASFRTDFYNASCATVFDTYMRDVDFSPDGRFFVVSTTGAYGGYGDLIGCDTAARFDVSSTGSGILPSWVSYTGGDTSYAVEVTGTAVYIGGHQRWWNNPYSGDSPGQGAVSRPGIAALNPINGIPFGWNPTRTRGIGVFDLLNTSQGLWVVSDTDRIGNYEYHARIAMFPAAGKQIPAYRSAPFPNAVYSAATGANPPLLRRSFDGTTAGATATVPSGGIDWSAVRGAFMVNGQLYLAGSDGLLTRRDFDGATYGTAVRVDGQDQITVLQNWRADVAAATGMFYDSGRIYYTLANNPTLFYRYVNLESDIVGAQRLTASGSVNGVSFSTVRGMFLGGDSLYWATSDGNLHAADWKQGPRAGAPVAGTATTASGPQIDGAHWSARVLFLYQDPAGQGAGLPPKAAFTQSCTSRQCTFSAAASTAPGSSIASYSWDFGDGSAPGTGSTPTHGYGSDSTFQVKLTVTSATGQSASVTQPVTVQRINQPPTAAFTHTCDQLTCSFDGGTSSDPDGTITGYAWDFGDGTTADGAIVEHTFTAGSYTVKLTVTDNDGATHVVGKQLDVSEAGVDFVAATAVNGNLATHSVRVPAAVSTGDRLLLMFSANANPTVTGPTGWTELRATNGSGILARAWTKMATGSDAGSLVQVGLSAYAKADLTVAAYRSTSGSTTIIDHAETSASGATSVTTPSLTLPSGAVPVYYVAVKSGAVVTATVPAALTQRSTSAGVPSGAMFSWTADAGYQTAASLPGSPIAFSGSVNRAISYGFGVGVS